MYLYPPPLLPLCIFTLLATCNTHSECVWNSLCIASVWSAWPLLCAHHHTRGRTAYQCCTGQGGCKGGGRRASQIFGTMKQACFQQTHNQGLCKFVLDCCPGTSAPSSAHWTVSLYLCSSGSNAQGELRALEGRCVKLKKPFKGPRWIRGSCWENLKRIVFSGKAH